MSQQKPLKPSSNHSTPPIQPALIGSLINGILTYCGLIVAGLTVTMSTERFSGFPTIFKIIAVVGIISSLAGGLLALISMANAVNHARRSEVNKKDSKINSARKKSVLFANLSLYAMIIGTISTAVTICEFAFVTQAAKSNSIHLIRLTMPPRQSEATSGDIDCYRHAYRSDADMLSPVSILSK